MKKILFVTAATSLNTHALDFACYLSKLTHSRLTGTFIDDAEAVHNERAQVLQAVVPGENTSPAADAQHIEENCTAFRDACTSREASCEIQTCRGVPQEEAVRLSRYADLIVTDADITFSNEPASLPSAFMREIMATAECPIITAPFRFEGIREIVFCYDGSASSMYAIRQFSYLLPELCDLDVTLVKAITPGQPKDTMAAEPDTWLQIHYPHYHIVVLEDERPRARLLDYLLSKTGAIIVMGAFGRGRLSDFVSPSHALPVLKFSNQPVFVTHY